MNFFNNILNKAAMAAEAINTDKIRWIQIEKIKIDPEIKAIFNQDENEIFNICEDMKVNGYNAGNPITLSQDNILVEGHTRYIAAQRAGLKKIAAVTKHFNSKQEMIEYAYKQQLHRRNLSEQDIFTAYKKLRAITNSDGKKSMTDVEIAGELHISPRQISKMKEVERKASSEIMSAFNDGSISLNQAYNQMKEELKPKESIQTELPEESEPVIHENNSEKDCTKASANTEENATAITESTPKAKKPAAEKPAFEKVNLKFKMEDFVLLQNAADAEKLSVSEYVMNLVMNSVQASSTETVSEKETA